MAKPVLKAGRGYKFVRKGRGAMLRRKTGAGAGGAGVSFSCSCHTSGAPGKCKVVIEPDGSTIGCEKDTCGGVCKWSVDIPGMTGVTMALTSKRG